MSTMDRDLVPLLANPRERLDCEIKGWLDLASAHDKATIAKACAALANHGGGHLVIGIEEDRAGNSWKPSARPDANAYTPDVNGIVAKYCDPEFQVDVDLVTHPSVGTVHPIVTVYGGLTVPVRCKRGAPADAVERGKYYVRRPGPKSEEPQTAQEWAELVRRCVVADRAVVLAQLSNLLGAPVQLGEVATSTPHERWLADVGLRFEALRTQTYKESVDPFRTGYWSFAYSLAEPKTGLTLAALRRGLEDCERRETGWPIGISLERDGGRPYLDDDCVEVWLGTARDRDGSHSDFWRSSPLGHFATARGHREDDSECADRLGTDTLAVAQPIWRVAEGLLHAATFAELFGAEDSAIEFTCEWRGLRDRELRAFSNDRWVEPGRTCRTESVHTHVRVDNAATVAGSLLTLVRSLTSRLYQAFDFFELTDGLLRSELDRFSRRR